MTDDQILDALTAEIVTALTTPELTGVTRVLVSTDSADLILRDVEGQLPAVGIADVALDFEEHVAIGQKMFLGRVEWEITIAAPAVGETAAAGRDTVRAIFGQVNKRLHNKTTSTRNRFKFLGFSYADQPRLDAVAGVARYEAKAVFGQE
jgi:hypothetical protein